MATHTHMCWSMKNLGWGRTCHGIQNGQPGRRWTSCNNASLPSSFFLHKPFLRLKGCCMVCCAVWTYKVLDRVTLARIWMGNITTWNDDAIKNTNPTLKDLLPNATIQLSYLGECCTAVHIHFLQSQENHGTIKCSVLSFCFLCCLLFTFEYRKCWNLGSEFHVPWRHEEFLSSLPKCIHRRSASTPRSPIVSWHWQFNDLPSGFSSCFSLSLSLCVCVCVCKVSLADSFISHHTTIHHE